MSDWKCCGQMSDCYQCEQGPKPEAPTEFRKANPGLSDSELAIKYATQPPKDSAREFPEMPMDLFLKYAAEISEPPHWESHKVIKRLLAAFEKLQRELADSEESFGDFDKVCTENNNLKAALDAKELRNSELVEMALKHDKRATDNLREANEERTRSAALVAAVEYAEGQLLHAGYAKNAVPAIRKAIADYKGGE